MTTKELMRLIPGLMILASVAGILLHSQWWLLLTGFVGLNLLQSSLTRWCFLETMLIKFGVPVPCTNDQPKAHTAA